MHHLIFRTVLAVIVTVSVLSAKTIYISNDGLDANTGTSESAALKTVAAAIPKAATGDSIRLRRGDVFYEGATFTQTGLVFTSYGDGAKAKPVMSGGITATGWTKHQGNIWVASLAQAPEYVFVNNEPVWCARYPNSGFVILDYHFQEGAGYRIRCRNITQCPRDAAGYWTGATMRWRRFTWWWETRKVLTYTSTAGWGEFTIDGGSGRNMPTQRAGFYFENKFTELDTANEWFYNTTEKKLYLWAPGSVDPNTVRVEGSSRTLGLAVSGSTISGIDFRSYKGPAVSMNGTTIVDRCRFDCIGGETGEPAVRGEAGTINAKVSNSFFRNIFNIGVHIQETAASGSATAIEYDTMQSIGNKPGWGAYRGTWHANRLNTHYCAVAISYGQNVRVRYNMFDSIGYAAVNPLDDRAVIEYNIINHAMSQLNDGAGIYAPTSYSTIRNNIILNTIGETKSAPWLSSIANGIWLEFMFKEHDNIVTGNTIAYGNAMGFWLPNNTKTTVTNNVMYGNATNQMRVDTAQGGGMGVQNHTITGNQFYCTKANQNSFEYVPNLDIGTVSGNYYCNPESDAHIIAGPRYTIPQWQAADPNIADKTPKTDIVKRPATPAPGDLTGTSKLLINQTGVRASIPVGDAGVYKDLNGNTVSGSVMIDPYSSLIIVHSGVTSIQGNSRQNHLLAGSSVTHTPGTPLLARIALAGTASAQMRVFNARGVLVGNLTRECTPGVNMISWNGGASKNRVAPGLYRYEIIVSSGGALRGTMMICR